MNCLKLTSTLCLGAFMLAALPGCGDKGTTTTGDESTTIPEDTTVGSTPTDSGTVTTNPELTTTSGDSESVSGGESSSTSTGPDTTATTGAPACPDPENQENNLACTDNSGCGCKSGHCFLVPILGGWCGECLTDADCSGGGCTVPNPLPPGTGSTCNMGEPGAGCMSDAICTDPDNGHCGTLLEVPGIISVATCSECSTNEDCADPMLPNCAPVYDVMNFTGKLTCVADGSVPQDGGCNLADDGMGAPIGNVSCMSGFCGEANVMGLLKVGICGECNSNEDCNGGTCTDPVVDLNTAMLVGSVCQ